MVIVNSEKPKKLLTLLPTHEDKFLDASSLFSYGENDDDDDDDDDDGVTVAPAA